MKTETITKNKNETRIIFNQVPQSPNNDILHRNHCIHHEAQRNTYNIFNN